MNQQSLDSPVKQVRWFEQTAIADVTGDIDLSRSSQFQKQLLQLLSEGPKNIIINLRDVPYMDSSGVASLVKLLRRARKSGVRLVLVEMVKRVKNVLEITRLDDVFDIFDNEQEAMA